jgi:GNAT superfamily N-acetyltransferase
VYEFYVLPHYRMHAFESFRTLLMASGAVMINVQTNDLFHYNRPYGDIYMDVAESFRRRGVGSFLVQELKRACYEGGNIPAARCNPGNIASRRTLQKSGFVPCGNILNGSVSVDPG